jgi:hypothetical protein
VLALFKTHFKTPIKQKHSDRILYPAATVILNSIQQIISLLFDRKIILAAFRAMYSRFILPPLQAVSKTHEKSQNLQDSSESMRFRDRNHLRANGIRPVGRGEE